MLTLQATKLRKTSPLTHPGAKIDAAIRAESPEGCELPCAARSPRQEEVLMNERELPPDESTLGPARLRGNLREETFP
jgi:hypothetical protein